MSVADVGAAWGIAGFVIGYGIGTAGMLWLLDRQHKRKMERLRAGN